MKVLITKKECKELNKKGIARIRVTCDYVKEKLKRKKQDVFRNDFDKEKIPLQIYCETRTTLDIEDVELISYEKYLFGMVCIVVRLKETENEERIEV